MPLIPQPFRPVPPDVTRPLTYILRRSAMAVALTLPCLLGAAMAQAEEDIGAHVLLELNSAQSADGACMLTFQVLNGHQTQIDRVVYETVLFDTDGGVNRLTLFDFGTLPARRPRVRQFSVPDMPCEGLGRILFNGAHVCDAPDLGKQVCEAGLETATRTQIEVLG